MGLTVVLARLNENTPIPAMVMPISTAPAAQMSPAGKVNSRAGVAQVMIHMNPPASSMRATGGTVNSKRCMGSIQCFVAVPTSCTEPRESTHDTRATKSAQCRHTWPCLLRSETPPTTVRRAGHNQPTDRNFVCGTHTGSWFARSDRPVPGTRRNRMRNRRFRSSSPSQPAAWWTCSLRP